MNKSVTLGGLGLLVLTCGLAFFFFLSKDAKQNVKPVKTISASTTQDQSKSSQSPVAKGDPVVPSEDVVQVPLNVERDGQTIVGQLQGPANYQEKRLPLVILSHGFGNTYDFVEGYADLLARRGYLVYIFDFIGGSHSSRSGGSMTEMSIFTEQKDLTAVLETLRNEDYVDESRVFLAGYSQGGVVSALTAADKADQVKGLITLNGAFVLFNDARSLFASKADIPEVYNHRGTNLGRVYFENLLDYDLYGQLSKFTGPALIIQGDADDIVPVKEAEDAAKALPEGKLEFINGAGHILDSSEMLQALSEVDAFLASNSQ